MGGRNSKIKENTAAEDETQDAFISFLDAASDGNFDVIEKIYEESKSPQQKLQLLLFQDQDQNMALHFAARNGSD